RLVLEYGCYGVSHCYFSCCCARSECDGSSCAMAVPPRRCARMLASETHGGGPDATAVPLAGIEARRRRKQVCTEQRIGGKNYSQRSSEEKIGSCHLRQMASSRRVRPMAKLSATLRSLSMPSASRLRYSTHTMSDTLA